MISSALVPLQTSGEEFAVDPTILIASTVVLLLISIGVGYWMYKDAAKRDNNGVLWAIITAGLLFFTFIGGLVALVVYFIVRGDEVTETSTRDEAVSGEW